MSSAEEDLDINPFYIALQDRYRSWFNLAQDRCHLICIPTERSLYGVNITQDFVDTHILKPSPFFKGQYLTTHLDNQRSLHLENNIIKLGSGFEEEGTFYKITEEELGYNKMMRPFRILILDRPLIGANPNQKIDTKTDDPFANRTSPAENQQFLDGFLECKKELSNLQEEVRRFQKTYMILPGYLDDAATKVKSICDNYTKAFLESCNHPMKQQKRFIDSVSSAVESVVLDGVYSTLYPVVTQQLAAADAALQTQCRQLGGLKSSQIGLDPDYDCDMTVVVSHLRRIDGLLTPIEKLHCIQGTIDQIPVVLNTHFQKLVRESDDGGAVPCVASDELLPLLVTVIVRATLPHLESNLYYLEHFHWSTSTTNELSFSLVTLQAAVEYVKTLKPENLRPLNTGSSTKVNKDQGHKGDANGIDGHMTDSADQSGASSKSADPSSSRKSRLDSQIDSISHMIRQNKLAPDTHNEYTPPFGPPRQRKKENKQLGGFLSSLQNDGMHSSFGRLN